MKKEVRTAVMLVRCTIGSDMNVLEKIKKVKGVAEAYTCYGEWDLFAILKGSPGAIDAANMKIRSIARVLQTVTLVAHFAVPSHRPYLRGIR